MRISKVQQGGGERNWEGRIVEELWQNYGEERSLNTLSSDWFVASLSWSSVLCESLVGEILQESVPESQDLYKIFMISIDGFSQ